MVLYLDESDVEGLLTMGDAIRAVEEAFAAHGRDEALNHPRLRLRNRRSMLHYLAGALPSMGVMGLKAYTSSRAGIKFRIFLHDIDDGSLLAVMDGNYMGMVRTGAATAVATRYMARPGDAVVGLIGTGWQARGQLMGIAEVRRVRKVKVYGRDEERRAAFARRMSSELEVEVEPVRSAEDAVRGADIVVTATTSAEPVFDGRLVEEGMHINAIGANFLYKREIDETTVRKSSIIVVESRKQCELEAGELLPLVDKGRLRWESLTELGEVVAGTKPGRETEGQITLFKSLGVAIEDVAVAARLYRLAREKGVGRELDMPAL